MPQQESLVSRLSLYNNGVRAPTPPSLLEKRMLRGGDVQNGLGVSPEDKQAALGGVMNTNNSPLRSSPVSRAPLGRARGGAVAPQPGIPQAPSVVSRAPQPSAALPNGRFPVAAFGPGIAAPGTALASASATPGLGPNSRIQNGSGGAFAATGDTQQAWRGSIQPQAPADLGGGAVLSKVSPGITKPPATPTTVAAQQTESANPLTGDTNALPGGSVQDLNHGRAMGFSTKGPTAPGGTDVKTAPPAGSPPTASVGGSGIYQRSFSSPTAAAIYHDYTRKLFGDAGQPAATPQAQGFLKRASGSANDQDGDEAAA